MKTLFALLFFAGFFAACIDTNSPTLAAFLLIAGFCLVASDAFGSAKKVSK